MKRAAPAAAVLLAGCAAAALDGQSILRPACGPTDGPAVELVVPASSGEYPQLRVTVWHTAVEGTTVTVAGAGARNGNAFWCTADERCEALTTATVAFGQKRSDASVHVTVDARLPDGTRFRKARRARWQPTRILCG